MRDPETPPPPISGTATGLVEDCASALRRARARGAAVMLIFGAHLIKNGGCPVLTRLMQEGWLTHLATNGAGAIHDWELAWLGATSESVRNNVPLGRFGTWHETAANIHLAVMAGALRGEGFGAALGRFVAEGGTALPPAESLAAELCSAPGHPLASARADVLRALQAGHVQSGVSHVEHRWKQHSVFATAWGCQIPATVHPGIGYDIISNHPIFSGSILGRAADWDFRQFGGAVEQLDGGVVLSVGSAVMGPQVFEKSLSCVNHLRLQDGRRPVSGHLIQVVDLQETGQWDWSAGEPPADHPAFYVRFCKSYSRMGGTMRYLQCDNVVFLHHLWHAIRQHPA